MKQQKGGDGAAGRTLRPPAMLVVVPVILIVLGLTYYLFVYLPAREQYFTDRAFRQLALASKQFEALIGVLKSAIQNAAATENPSQTIQLVANMQARDCPEKCAAPQGTICVGWDPPQASEGSSAQRDDDSALRQSPTLRRSARLYFAFTKPEAALAPASKGAAAATLGYCASASLNDLLMPLVGGTAFEDFDVFLASADGEVLFERGRSGLRLAALPKGKAAKGGGQQDGRANDKKDAAKDPLDGLPPIETLQQEGALTDVHIGQATYALFTQPVRLVVHDVAMPLDDAPPNATATAHAANQTWVLGALVDRSRFANQSRAVSFAVMGWVPLLGLFTLALAPAFKVWAVGRRDRLTTTDMYFFAIGTMATVCLVVVMVMITYANQQVEEHEDTRLREFATKLCGNFQDDLTQAYDALKTFVALAKEDALKLETLQKKKNADVERRELEEAIGRCAVQTNFLNNDQHPTGKCDEHTDIRNRGATCAVETDALNCTDAPFIGNDKKLLILHDELLKYPFFRQLSWADRKEGTQREKWTAGETATNLIRVKDQPPFEDPMNDRSWSFTGNPHRLDAGEELDRSPRELVFHSQVSQNTGEALPMLSVPVRDDSSSTQPDRIVAVATMIMAGGPLLTPLLPPGFGFAVIQSDGEVLFHSDVNRNLRENLFDECEPSGGLRAAVFARHADYFNVDYIGRAHRLYLHPMENTPWTLVAFRDKELLRNTMLEIAVPCVLLLAVYVGLYLFAMLFVRMAWPKERGKWMWPTPLHSRAYRECAVLFALAGAFDLWVIHAESSPAAVLVCVAMPFAAVTLLFLKLSDWSSAPAALRGLGYATLVAVAAAVFAGAKFSSRPLVWSALWLGLVSLALLGLLGRPVAGELFNALWLGLVSRARRLLRKPDTRDADSAPTGKLPADYIATSLTLLALVAVLPTVGLFQDAHQQGIETFVRLGQLRHAEARAKRAAQLKERYEGYLTPEQFKQWVARPADDAADLTEIPPKDWLAKGTRKCPTPSPLTVTGLLVRRFPVYNRESQQLRELIHGQASDHGWCSQVSEEGTDAVLQVRDERFLIPGATGFEKGQYAVGQKLQPLSLPSHRDGYLLFLGLLIVGYAAHLGARATAERLFGANLESKDPQGDGAVLLTGWLLLKPPRLVVEALKRTAAEVFDFQCESLLRLKERLASLPSDAPGFVLVDHLDYRLGDAEYRRAKLALLEELVLNRAPVWSVTAGWKQQHVQAPHVEAGRDGLTLIAVSDEDLLRHFAAHVHAADESPSEAQSMTPEEFDRWVRVLTPLARTSCEEAASGKTGVTLERLMAECKWTPQLRGIELAITADDAWTRLSEAQLVKRVGEYADAHYRDLWARCSIEDRLVLIHMVSEGFVSPRNWEVVRRLMSKHLIRRDPTFRVMNDSFEQFVQAAESREPITEWEKAGTASPWTRWRTGILLLLVVGGIFLFTTQPDQFNVWLGFAGALAGGLGTMMQLLRMFQQSKDAPPSGH